MFNSKIAILENPLSKVIAIDRNICISIINKYNIDILSELKEFDTVSTIVITCISFLEAMGKNYKNSKFNANGDYIRSLLEESSKITNFFKYAITDIPALKDNEESRRKNDIGINDFKFKNQIKFHKFLIHTIGQTPEKSKIKDKFYEIIHETAKLNLFYYFPIVINAIAALYQHNRENYARKLLKLKENESFNVVSDMTHPLRAISLGYSFILKCNSLDCCEFCFFTNDKYLKNFLLYIDYYGYFLKLKGIQDGVCPIDKDYFGNIPDEEWAFLRRLVISGNYTTYN